MITTRYWTGQHELLHWLLIIATAIALTLAVARVLGAADPIPKPGHCPATWALLRN